MGGQSSVTAEAVRGEYTGDLVMELRRPMQYSHCCHCSLSRAHGRTCALDPSNTLHYLNPRYDLIDINITHQNLNDVNTLFALDDASVSVLGLIPS